MLQSGIGVKTVKDAESFTSTDNNVNNTLRLHTLSVGHSTSLYSSVRRNSNVFLQKINSQPSNKTISAHWEDDSDSSASEEPALINTIGDADIIVHKPDIASDELSSLLTSAPQHQQENRTQKLSTKSGPIQTTYTQTKTTEKRSNKTRFVSTNTSQINGAKAKLLPLERNCWIYVSNLSSQQTTEDILDVLKELDPSADFSVEKPEALNKKKTSSVFVVRAPLRYEATLKDPNFWPANTYANKYFHPRNKHQNFPQTVVNTEST